jgi:phenylpropionate dioxygenase-like ring-hydroxylating dioxygenase large terminal subunit
MLSAADNILLTDVGPGTPMGTFMREYWMPALLSTELPRPGSPPVRILLLCERLVAFRDTEGKVGLIAEACPHRQASLSFGNSEDGGLRCAYHGWKFGLDGQCLEIPTEPRHSAWKKNVRAVAYPCVERGDLVWTYMGPRSTPPPLPCLQQNTAGLPPGAVQVENNWLQSVEGDIDITHIPILHRRNLKAFAALCSGAERAEANDSGKAAGSSGVPPRRRSPVAIEVEDTAAGFAFARSKGFFEDSEMWEIGHFLFPFYSNLPYGELGSHWIVARVPMDNLHTMTFSMWGKDIRRPPQALMLGPEPALLPNTGDWFGRFRMARNGKNDFGLDRRGSETFGQGFAVNGQGTQDAAMTWSMGGIMDRSKEHLVPADVAIVHLRRRLLEAIRSFRAAGAPGIDLPQAYRVEHGTIQIGGTRSWRDVLSKVASPDSDLFTTVQTHPT